MLKTTSLLAATAAFAMTAVMATTWQVTPAMAEDAAAAATEIVGDPAKGKRVFNRCKACHTVEKDGPNRVGPNLYGVVGAEFGHIEGYKFSPNLMELKAEGKVWDVATLDAYLKQPKDVIPKGSMAFVGLRKETDRAHVIAYLATFGGPEAASEAAPAE